MLHIRAFYLVLAVLLAGCTVAAPDATPTPQIILVTPSPAPTAVASPAAVTDSAPAGFTEPVCEAWHVLRGISAASFDAGPALLNRVRDDAAQAAVLLDSVEPWAPGERLKTALDRDAAAVFRSVDLYNGPDRTAAVLSIGDRLTTLIDASDAHALLKAETGFDCGT